MSPLQKSLVPVSFGQGVDTKTDQKQVTLGKLLALENATFESPQKLTKRLGYSYLQKFQAGQTGAGQALIPYDNALLVADGQTLSSYDESAGQFEGLGPLESTGAITQQRVVVDSAHQINGYDLAVHPLGTQLAVYERDSLALGGSYYVVKDMATGSLVFGPQMLSNGSTGGKSPKVIVAGNYFVVLFISANILYGMTVDPITGSSSGPTPLTGGAGVLTLNTTLAFQQYDACSTPATDTTPGVYISFINNVGAGHRGVTTLFSTLAAPLTPLIPTATLPNISPSCVCVFRDAFTQGAVVGYAQSAGGVGYVAYAAALGAVLGNGNLDGVPPGSYIQKHVTGISTSSVSLSLVFAWTYRSPSTNPITNADSTSYQNDYVLTNTVTGSYVSGSALTVRRSVSLCGKAFSTVLGGGTPLVVLPVVFDNSEAHNANPLLNTYAGQSNPQSTYFLIDIAGIQIARYAPGAALGHYRNATGSGMLPESPTYNGQIVMGAATVYSLSEGFSASGPLLIQNVGLSAFTFNPAPGYVPRAQLADIVHIGGSYVFESDASGVPVEHFYAYSPWIASMVPGTFGMMTAGDTYQFIATYEWVDANGQTQVSAPSIASSFTLGKNSATLTLVSVINGDSVTINSHSYAAGADFSVGANDTITAQNLAGTINLLTVTTGVTAVVPVTTNVISLISTTPTLTITETGGTITDANLGPQLGVTLTIPTLRMTAKTGLRGEVKIGVYRTAGNGAAFYRERYVTNDPTVDTVTAFCGSVPDAPGVTGGASIVGLDPLYAQNGGVLDNDTPPPTQAMVEHRNRIFLVDSTDPLSVWYSKLVIHTPGTPTNNPVEFSAFQIIIAPERGGPVTALGSMDDKLIAFKKNGPIYYLTGQGPTANGQNNDFSDFQAIAVDCGAISQASIVETTNGLMFQGTKGIYLLTRQLAVEYIGAPVESFNSQTVTSAVLIGDVNQVRFTMSGGSTLVYDYLMGQWSVSTFIWFGAYPYGTHATDSCQWQGQNVFLLNSAHVFQEIPGQYFDMVFFDEDPFHEYISMRALTPPLALAGLQGFQRIYKVFVLGSAYTKCNMDVSLGYNYAALTQVNQIGVAGTETPLQWRIDCNQQKCEAIQIQIQDRSLGGKIAAPGEGIDLSGFSLEIGQKQGGYKLPAAQSTG